MIWMRNQNKTKRNSLSVLIQLSTEYLRDIVKTFSNYWKVIFEASDFIQQVVLFSYSVGVFAGYYYYTKWFTSETMKVWLLS